MSKEEWAKIEKALSGTYGYVKLRVDDREVTFQRQLVDKNKLGIVTYVDGVFKGAWIGGSGEHPEQAFLCRRERYVFSAKERAQMKKLGKRRLKEWGYDPDKKWAVFSPSWPSVTAIRRHYQKTFTSIELIEVVG